MYYVGILTINKTLQVLQKFFASNNKLGRGGGGELSPGGVKLLYWGCSKVSFYYKLFLYRYLTIVL